MTAQQPEVRAPPEHFDKQGPPHTALCELRVPKATDPHAGGDSSSGGMNEDVLDDGEETAAEELADEIILHSHGRLLTGSLFFLSR
jgi:hypothetical protein